MGYVIFGLRIQHNRQVPAMGHIPLIQKYWYRWLVADTKYSSAQYCSLHTIKNVWYITKQSLIYISLLLNLDVGTIEKYVNSMYISIQMFLGGFLWDCFGLKNPL